MPLIHDGYTRFIQIGHDRFSFRPVVAEDRKMFYWHAGFFGPDVQRDLVTAVVKQQLVAGSELANDEAIGTLFLAIHGLIPDASGKRWADLEDEWRTNLEQGVRLLVLHPEVATRDCVSCQKWWYNERGSIILDNFGQPLERVGETPCRVIGGVGCPKGTPENQLALSRANKAAFAHFLKCDATGNFPVDSVVAKNAKVIRAVMRECDMIRQRKQAARTKRR